MRQRYSITESINRILRLFEGNPEPTDAPETLSGDVLSVDGALSDLAELLGDSLPDSSFALPQSFVAALGSAGIVTGTATEMAILSYSGDLIVATGTSRLYNKTDTAFFISEAFCSVGTPPTDSSILVDVNINGSSIFAVTRPEIPAGSVTGSSTSLSATAWAVNDYLTLDIDQIGSGTAGSDLLVHLSMKATSVL